MHFVLLFASLVCLFGVIASASDCKIADIQGLKVASSKCTCQGQKNCGSMWCNLCTNYDFGNPKLVNPPFAQKKYTHGCNSVGCSDKLADCAGCGIVFHSLCNCLKNPKCPHSGAGTPKPGDNRWFFLDSATGDKLYTTNQFVPGIETMSASVGNVGFDFAQGRYQTGQALALNSIRARTHEQIHIHQCELNQKTLGTLSSVPVFAGTEPRQLKQDGELYCVQSKAGQKLDNFGSTIANFIAKPPLGSDKKPLCVARIGAGMVKDTKGRTWGCLTYNREGGEAKFCKEKPHT